ncbi:Tol-Pal system beta propeller repeat protein TolB [Gammaproteobacteria bacterium]|nr:Tol-Pal system beta propeller repeat protein TolB [Gammaproteobacteria bacterium]|tara:strand:+ start:8168 stop:9442 length:1275 start_codon:yes stop_codon:yes gene_type:complete
MKKIIFLFLISINTSAELVLEITESSDNPYRIAIHSFDGQNSISQKISQIIKADLLRTGEFSVLGSDELLSEESYQDQINYRNYRLLGVDYILKGKVNSEDKMNITVSYDIFDSIKEKKIRSSKIFGIPNKTRQLAHYVSDGIYEEITGLQGVASTKMLYVSEDNDGTSKVYRLMLADADGMNEQTLLKSNSAIISPSWSPDSKDISYVSFETGTAKVFIQNIATGKREVAVENKYQISSPSFSPDGKFLSLTLYQDGNAEIYILNLKNKNLTRLTNHYSIDTESSWSPDGKKILFTSGRSGSPQLYEIDLLKFNTKPKRLTFEGNYNAKASYLPTNEGIVFVHRADKKFQIALKYFNENFSRPLTESRLDESPSISPNGNVIVYAIKEDETGLLAGVTLSGARFRLPATSGEVREPSWSGFLR